MSLLSVLEFYLGSFVKIHRPTMQPTRHKSTRQSNLSVKVFQVPAMNQVEPASQALRLEENSPQYQEDGYLPHLHQYNLPTQQP